MNSETSLPIRVLAKIRSIILISVICASLAVLATSAREWKGKNLEAKEAERISGQGQTTNRLVPIALLNLTRFGFEPSSLKLPAGQCRLAVRNITGFENLDLQVSRKNGERLLLERYPRGRRQWEKSLVLPAGEYVISVASKPQWIFNLTVVSPDR